ncbi:hypothetical protein [Brevundimonas sp.]|uniref:hypothetical protein n=1 Tax=Brevundimonas sp. TaxID=1871086 RepID=UPI002737B2E0|nr:hypothetical protein [Brevundimonas sp.]MDP3803582.1 hypothetical protein [Brevundimonas sp.]
MSGERHPKQWARTFLWQVRRELWEHRALWVAPLAVAAFAALVHLGTTLTATDAGRTAALADPARAGEFMTHYSAMIGATVVTGLLVGVLYSLDALQGERRDRSILFWKSLPVSDGMTVLSKAIVPLVVVPLIVFPIVVVASLLMLGLQSLIWSLDGYDPGQLWARVNLPFLWLALLYGLPFMALWNAPLYAWMLLMSAWSRRVAFLWAAAPFAAILMIEHLALHHTPSHWMLERRIAGGVLQPWSIDGEGVVWIERLSDLDPMRIYSLPGLWIGVLIAAGLLYAAIRIRRSRTPN